MGEIQNKQERKETLKRIIKDLHAGVETEDIKARFSTLLDQVGPTEIGEIEQSLVNEGLPIEEIQKLCDIHVAVFKESLEKQKETEAALTAKSVAKEPLENLQAENRQIKQLVQEIRELIDKIKVTTIGESIKSTFDTWALKHTQLLRVDQHYAKKENILFPYLERNGITGPPSVMWGVHDEIRAELKKITQVIDVPGEKIASGELNEMFESLVLPALNAVDDMIYKEENILFPMCRDTFKPEEWEEIRVQLDDPMAQVYQVEAVEGVTEGVLDLDVGRLTPEQINLVFKHLPIDITFVDEKDEVAYFSLGPERIFERARAVIGRKVQFCHPPNSMGVVEQILDDFKSGRKDSADFWINMGEMVVYIRYFAVRDEDGTYRGTLEVSQNIAPLQKLTGEHRLYDYAKEE